MIELVSLDRASATLHFVTPTPSGVVGLRGYFNSKGHREQLQLDCPPETVKEVLAVWGDSPTVEEKTDGLKPDYNPLPTQGERIAALEGAVFELMKGGLTNV